MSRKRRERREAQRATAVAERAGNGVAESLRINGDEIVDRSDWGPIGWGFQNGLGFGLNLMSSLNDRRDGRNAPFVENEYDAATIRGFARFITTANCPGVGIVKTLVNYIIGRGIKATVSTKKGKQAPDGIVECAQDIIDEFNEDNKIVGNFDRESCRRDHRDGEGYVGLYPKNRKTVLRSIEPDNVKDPGSPPFSDEELAETYGLAIEYPTAWHWGHHADEHDPENTHGYCIQWKAADPYDYLPARYVHHSKADDNNDRTTPRGMSDFLPAWQWLKQQERLLRNAGEGAAELAAISYITQFSSATQEQVRTMRAGQADYELTRTSRNGGSNTTYKRRRDPGVLNIPQGQEYKEAPMGAERGEAFLKVVQGILRQVGVCWAMTEGMISGDDSNNNMASSVEAGSRFWKYADAQQGAECAKWQQIYVVVLRNAYDMGRFERFGVTWEELRRLLVITVSCPEIDVRDPKILAETRAIEKANGILSAKTWADEAGYDHDKEVSQGAVDTVSAAAGAADPSGQPGRQAGEYEDKSRLQWKRNVKAIQDILDQVKSEGMTIGHAKIQLGLLGLAPDKIDALLADIADGSLTPENQQSLSETYAAHVSPHWRLVLEAEAFRDYP